jgi:hypothetical protein
LHRFRKTFPQAQFEASTTTGYANIQLRDSTNVRQADFVYLTSGATVLYGLASGDTGINTAAGGLGLGTADVVRMYFDAVGGMTSNVTATWSNVQTHSQTASNSSLLAAIRLVSTNPILAWSETDAATANREWAFAVQGAQFKGAIYADNGSTETLWLSVARTAVAVTSLSFGNATDNPTYNFLGTGGGQFNGRMKFDYGPVAADPVWLVGADVNDTVFLPMYRGNGTTRRGYVGWPTATGNLYISNEESGGNVNVYTVGTGVLNYNDMEVGYRSLICRTPSASDNTVASDNGRGIFYGGAAGSVFTINSNLPTNAIITIINNAAGSITIAESLTNELLFFNGSGFAATGSRTLAAAGVATVWILSGGSYAVIWGVGLS